MAIKPVSGEIKAQVINDNLSYLDSKTESISKMVPSGTYATYLELKQAFPAGNSNVYIVSENGHWYYWNSADWISGGVFATGENFALLTTGKNLFDKTKAIEGQYVFYADGKLGNAAGFFVTDFIKVKPNTAYAKNDTQQLAFYATNDQTSYVSGIETALTFVVPSNANYVRISVNMHNATKETFQLEEGTESTEYESFGYFVKKNQLDPSLVRKIEGLEVPNSVVTVAKSGGEFASINSAKASINQSGNRKTMRLYPGDYNEVVDLRGNQFVDIIGINKETTQIVDKSGSYESSPLNVSGNGYFKNITFLANHDDLVGTLPEKTSYAVHIDHVGTGKLVFEDCQFISYQNSAVGIGMHADQTIIFRRCQFYTNSNYGACVYAHNNIESDIANQRLVFEECTFISEKGDSLRVDDANIIFGDNLGNDMTIKFINNYFYSYEKEAGVFKANNESIGVGTISGRVKLDKGSYGNNIDALNYAGQENVLQTLLEDYINGKLGGSNSLSFEQN